jgi:hypothetical protein
MPPINSLTFPSFYAECAYRDGVRSVRDHQPEIAASYMRHGDVEPLGMDWFKRGAMAATLGVVGN